MEVDKSSVKNIHIWVGPFNPSQLCTVLREGWIGIEVIAFGNDLALASLSV